MTRLREEASGLVRAFLTRRMAPAVAAVLLVLGFSTIGVALGEPEWITALVALSIVVVAMMFGVLGGFAAAFIASAGFLARAIDDHGFGSADLMSHRHLLFFALGLLTGYFAKGALGDYHLGRALVRGRLREAIRRGHVSLHYQPVVEARSGRVVAFEALARWDHPRRGTLMPGEFVPAAEGERGTILELTRLTLRLAIEECGRWQARGVDIGVAVNVSVAVIEDSELGEEIASDLSVNAVSPGSLTLEITESVGRDDLAPALRRVRAAARVSIAIDDFGTGYSSLARLEELPVDALKIDQRFTHHAEGERRRLMLKAIIDLAHRLDLTTCAEGIEDRAAWDLLARLGCDTVQGFAVGRPMPAAQVDAWLGAAARNGYRARSAPSPAALRSTSSAPRRP